MPSPGCQAAGKGLKKKNLDKRLVLALVILCRLGPACMCSPKAYEGMEARSGQSPDNKIALQVSFNPTAVNIMDLLNIFVINKQYLFQRVQLFLATWVIFVLIIRILFSFIPWIILEWYVESFSSNVYWELFFHWAENYFSWYAILQCFWALAVEVDWFETLTSLGDHFENFANGGVLPKRMPSRNSIRERNKSGFHLSYKIFQEPVVCAFVMRFSGPKI